jgi:hypothetical protein
MMAMLAHRLSLLLIVLIVAVQHPDWFDGASRRGNWRWLPNAPEGLWSWFSTWDANYYLALAERGYQPTGMQNAFWPLYPALIALARPLTANDTLLAGLLVSITASIAAAYCLYLLAARCYDPTTALFAVAAWSLWPGSYVLVLPYSESCFALLLALLLLGCLLHRTWPLAVAAFLLPLSRPTGFVAPVPLIWQAWTQRSHRRQALAALLAFMAGVAGYFAIMTMMTGDPAAGFAAGRYFIFQPSISKLLDLPGALAAFCDIRALHGLRYSLLDRAMFVITVLLLWPLRRDRLLLLTASTLIYQTGLGQHFSAYIRYSAINLPLFIGLGHLLARGPRMLTATVLGLSFIGQCVLLLLHASNRWVA